MIKGGSRQVGNSGYFTLACHYGFKVIIIKAVSLSFLSPSSVMAMSSSAFFLVLLISSLDWLSARGSFFSMDQDPMTSSGAVRAAFFHCRYLLAIKRDRFDARQNLSLDAASASCLSNINQCDLGPRGRGTLLTRLIAAYVRHQLQKAVFVQIHVEMFTVEQMPHLPGLACKTGSWSIEQRLIYGHSVSAKVQGQNDAGCSASSHSCH